MDFFKASERLMSMDDATWARHASPWSVYSRIATLPLLSLAIWSRAWIGWGALIAIAIAVFLIWVNPRAFSAPKTRDHWAAKGTFGERVFLNRDQIPIPAHHRSWAYGLTLVSAAGLPPWVYGLWAFSLPWTLLGITLILIGKVWFVDRMVWLYEDMKDADETYRGWMG